MKHFTKEYYHCRTIARFREYFTVSSSAKRRSESYFQHLYQKKLEDELLSAQRIAEGQAVDEEQIRKRVGKNLENTISMLQSLLPKDLLDQVADIRVLALGFCSHTVKKELNRFFGRYRQACEQEEQSYDDYMMENHEALGDRVTLFGELEMNTIFSARWEGEDLVFQASDWDQEECPDAVMTFRFRCAKLLELDVDKVEDLVHLECMDCELYMVPGGYEFHLILSHPNTDRPPFYYCTIQARTVRIYDVNGQELKRYDDYYDLIERLDAKYTTKE